MIIKGIGCFNIFSIYEQTCTNTSYSCDSSFTRNCTLNWAFKAVSNTFDFLNKSVLMNNITNDLKL